MGITTKKKEVVVNVMPPRPEYKFMSKAQVIEAQKKDREIEAQTKAFRDELKNKPADAPKVEAPQAEAPLQVGIPKDGLDGDTNFSSDTHANIITPVVEKKKAGRPRKIE